MGEVHRVTLNIPEECADKLKRYLQFKHLMGKLWAGAIEDILLFAILEALKTGDTITVLTDAEVKNLKEQENIGR